MTLYQQIQAHKTRSDQIATLHHAVNLCVFGSVARDDESPHSDIDFLVEFLPGSTLVDHVALVEALSEELGRKVDVISEQALHQR